jgi:two-component system, NarL family, sensor histidine kinase UhpB
MIFMKRSGCRLSYTAPGQKKAAPLKLRTHVNLIVGFLSAGFIALVVSAELDSTRRAISEEMSATNVVAAQVFKRVADTHADSASLLVFLQGLGRVRANEVTLYSPKGVLLYRSPDSTYKAGREAPQWFVKLLLPLTTTRELQMKDGSHLTVAANPSRAILDGWDDMFDLLVTGAITLGVLNGLVFWWVSRALSPLPVIAAGLSRLRQGELQFRLPVLRGAEASVIGLAFNDMAVALEEKVQAERHARDVEARLDERREMAQLIEQRLEEERRMIARELHDEFAQSVTAIRSLAASITAQVPGDESSIGQAAQLISSEAASLYDAMHGLIPRLTPLTLDTLGLAATLEQFVAEWQKRNPAIRLSLTQALATHLGSSVALTIYRIVQEALINALRHAHASQIDIHVECSEQCVIVQVLDDGVGLSVDWSRPGRFGLRGLRDRVQQLHGQLHVFNRPACGVAVRAEIPLSAVTGAVT